MGAETWRQSRTESAVRPKSIGLKPGGSGRGAAESVHLTENNNLVSNQSTENVRLLILSREYVSYFGNSDQMQMLYCIGRLFCFIYEVLDYNVVFLICQCSKTRAISKNSQNEAYIF